MALPAVRCVLLVLLLSACHVALCGGVMRGAMVGGWNALDPQSRQVQDVAKKGVQLFNSEANLPNYFRLIQVLSAQAQVTNALNYKVTAIIQETKCSKSEDEDPDKCELGEKKMQCDFQVTYSFLYVGARVRMSCRSINVSLSEQGR